MATPKYVERISRLPGVFEHLLAHPDGMPLRQLADDFHVDPDVLREDLLAFYAADVAPDLLLGLMRPGVLEFLGPDGDDEDPAAAEIVKISDPRSIDELGVEHVDASELALIYTAATSLLDVEPDNDDLAAAIDALSETMLGDAAPDGAGPAPWTRLLEPIAEGQRRRVRVDIVYSRRGRPVSASARSSRTDWSAPPGLGGRCRPTRRTRRDAYLPAQQHPRAEPGTRPSSCPTTSSGVWRSSAPPRWCASRSRSRRGGRPTCTPSRSP